MTVAAAGDVVPVGRGVMGHKAVLRAEIVREGRVAMAVVGEVSVVVTGVADHAVINVTNASKFHPRRCRN